MARYKSQANRRRAELKEFGPPEPFVSTAQPRVWPRPGPVPADIAAKRAAKLARRRDRQERRDAGVELWTAFRSMSRQAFAEWLAR